MDSVKLNTEKTENILFISYAWRDVAIYRKAKF